MQGAALAAAQQVQAAAAAAAACRRLPACAVPHARPWRVQTARNLCLRPLAAQAGREAAGLEEDAGSKASAAAKAAAATAALDPEEDEDDRLRPEFEELSDEQVWVPRAWGSARTGRPDHADWRVQATAAPLAPLLPRAWPNRGAPQSHAPSRSTTSSTPQRASSPSCPSCGPSTGPLSTRAMRCGARLRRCRHATATESSKSSSRAQSETSGRPAWAGGPRTGLNISTGPLAGRPRGRGRFPASAPAAGPPPFGPPCCRCRPPRKLRHRHRLLPSPASSSCAPLRPPPSLPLPSPQHRQVRPG
jgi:hypothetical protein